VDGILIEAELNMTSAHRGDLQEKLMRTASRRRSSRYVPPFNAGSIFKNPPHRSAGNLIDRCLLKGLREGDAQIYGGHGNIIVNLGNATSTHILKLIATVKEAVYKRSGIELEEEIRIL
jgi:UDP-N-acetylmuramate dehydrogenase